jgi:uncharacterized membrane protein YraQ (UPF0718 family)
MQFHRRPVFDWSTLVIAVLMIAAAALVYLRDGHARFIEVIWSDFDLFADMLPKVLAGCLIASFITVLLPREAVARWVGPGSGTKGILIATLAGVIAPGGPFTIFPIAGAFLAIGADAGAAIALITSWSLLGFNRAVIWEMPFFSFDFVAWRSLAALPLPILAGLLARFAARAMGPRQP